MVQYAIKGEEKKAETVASLLDIDDPKISDRANQLYNSVKALKERCCDTIFEHFDVYNKNLLLTTVNKYISDFHLKTHSGGIIWHSAQEDIIDSVTAAMKLERRSFQ